MHIFKATEAFLVTILLSQPNVDAYVPSFNQGSVGEKTPADIPIDFLNWIKERRASSASTTTTSISTLNPQTLMYPSHQPASSNLPVFGGIDASDILSRYRDTEKRSTVQPQAPHFNTPQFPITTIGPPHSLNRTILAHLEKTPPYGKASAGIIALLTIVISVLTIGGNALVLAAFYIERNLRMPTNYFIASLAVTDILIGIFSMNLYTLYLLLDYWPLGRLLCDLWLGLDYTLCLTSQYTVFFITLDRFFSVNIPAKYRMWRTSFKVLIMIAVTWIIPSSIFFTTILGWPYFSKDNHVRKTGTCYAEFSSNPMFNTILTIAYFWLTLSVMTGLYIGIYRVALRLQKKSKAKREKMKNYLIMTGKDMNRLSANPMDNNNNNDSNYRHVGYQNDARVTSSGYKSEKEQFKYSEERHFVVPARASQPPKEEPCDPHLPHFDTVSPEVEPDPPMTTNDSCNKEPQASFYKSHSCEVPKYSPKASPTSIAESMFCQIRSPHLSDPEITECARIDGKALYMFPSSPAVNILPDQDSCNSSNNSSLRLSLAYSQELNHQPFIHNHEAPKCLYEKACSLEHDVISDSSADQGYHFSHQPESPTAQRVPNNCMGFVNLLDDNLLQVCPFLETDAPETQLDQRRVSENTAAQVAQIWQDRLQKQAEQNLKPPEAKLLKNSVPNHQRQTPETSRNSTNDTSDSLLSKRGQSQSKFERQSATGKSISFIGSLFRSLRRRFVTAERDTPVVRGRTENRARKALKTISFILGAFVLCWTPYHIVILIKGFCDNPAATYTCVNDRLYSVTYWMCYMNSPVNPFCYALSNAQFKQAFLRILRFDLQRR